MFILFQYTSGLAAIVHVEKSMMVLKTTICLWDLLDSHIAL